MWGFDPRFDANLKRRRFRVVRVPVELPVEIIEIEEGRRYLAVLWSMDRKGRPVEVNSSSGRTPDEAVEHLNTDIPLPYFMREPDDF